MVFLSGPGTESNSRMSALPLGTDVCLYNPILAALGRSSIIHKWHMHPSPEDKKYIESRDWKGPKYTGSSCSKVIM